MEKLYGMEFYQNKQIKGLASFYNANFRLAITLSIKSIKQTH